MIITQKSYTKLTQLLVNAISTDAHNAPFLYSVNENGVKIEKEKP